jgi:RNA polymerase sigma factor (sigma-70 family)
MTDETVPPQQGDEEQLFQRYHARLRRRTAFEVKTSPEIVDDACAYAWMQLITRQPRRETAYGWLVTVARNEALRLDQLARVRASRQQSLNFDEHAGDLMDATRGRVELAMDLQDLRARLLELSPRERETVLLHAAGWRYAQLAERLGISQSRVSHLFTRGVQRMREMDQREEEPRSPRGRRLREIEHDPPRYILAAIGPEPRASTSTGLHDAQREWKRLVLQIEDYREANGIADDIVALGRGERVAPGDLIARRIVDYRRARGLGMAIEL